MATSFLTSLSEAEFKDFLKQAVSEVLNGQQQQNVEQLPDIMDIKQAAAYLKLKVNTLYEKTAQKLIPHFKKGGKLLFVREELLKWVREGKVSTLSELQTLAATHQQKKRRS